MISYDQWKFAKNWMADVLCMKYKSYFGAWEKNYFLKIGSLFSNVLKFFFFLLSQVQWFMPLMSAPGRWIREVWKSSVIFDLTVNSRPVGSGSNFFFFFSQGSFGNCSEYFHSAVYSTKSSVSNFHFTLILKRGFYVACLWVWASAQTWGWSDAFPPSVSLPSILR